VIFLEIKKLPKRTLLLWQIRLLLVGILLAAACLVLSNIFEILSLVALVLFIIIVLIVLAYLPAFFKGYEIQLKEDAIIINYGVFIKVSHIMPYSRLIYAQSFATPLARIMKVATLTLKAARSIIIIPEIEYENAKAVIASLAKEKPND
jgi:membrane protein YdbS with pleckstrin-like domain